MNFIPFGGSFGGAVAAGPEAIAMGLIVMGLLVLTASALWLVAWRCPVRPGERQGLAIRLRTGQRAAA